MTMRALFVVTLATATALVLTACPSEVNPTGGGCGPDESCADGLVCQDGACIARCDDGEGDCAAGICDVTSGLCVDCLRAEDCGDGLVCNEFTNRCVEPVLGCTSDSECGGLRCDTIKGACVECLSEGDCDGGALCDFITSTCVTEQSCVTDGDCTDSVCEPTARVCVECFNPAHCASGVCDTLSGTCVVGCEDDDATEPNDGENAVTLAPGGAHEGGICAGDVDEFFVTIDGDDATLTATLTIDGGAVLDLRLLNAGGSLVTSSTPAPVGAELTASGLAAGIYRLVVDGATAEDAGDYLLSVEVDVPVVCAQLDTEPNNTTGQAPTIAADNALHAGSICGADTDLFEFNVTAGQDVEAAVVAGDGAGTLAVAIVGATGSVLAQGNPSTLANVAAGTLYVRVTATGGDVTYSVRVNATDPDEPPVCNQTDAEPNNADAQALPLSPGTVALGTICPGDVDQHRFAATALDDVTVTVQGTGLTARLIRASDGAEIASGLFINETDLAAGGYRVVVQGATATTQTTYSVDVQLTPEPVPDVCDEGGIEPDARADARTLALDGTPQAGRICASDTDFFTFTLPFDSTVTIHSRFVDASGDLDMRLTDSAGGLIASSAGVTDDEIIVRNLTAGTYGVEMFGFLGALNTYTMEATLQGCTPDDGFEVNNTFALATPIGGTVVSGARCPGDDDFFLVRMENGDALNATLSGAGLTFSLVSSTDGTVLVNDTANGASGRRIQVSGLPAGRYVFRVTGSGADRVAYTLTPTITASPARCIDDGAAPNDTSATAFPLDDDGLLDGSYDVGSLVSCGVVDADWFTVSLPGQKLITVQMAFDAPTSDVDIELLEPRAATGLTRSIARSFAIDKQDRVSGMINAGGTFLLRAVGFDDVQTKYSIGIEVDDPPASSCVDDKFDTWTATSSGTNPDATFKNDAPTSAVTVSSGEAFGSMRVCPANADWLKINAAVGQRVVVHVDYAHASGRDIDVRLYGPANQTTPVASSVGTDGTEDISFTATAAGDHFIEVFGFQNGENFYDLDVTLQ